MKSLPYFLFIAAILAFSTGLKHPHPVKLKTQPPFGFTADSGYVSKSETIKILQQIIATDTIDPDWSEFNYPAWADLKDTDTLGKYYRNASGNIFACISVPSVPAFIVAEINPQGNIIKNEAFSGGAYLCCMDNLENVFRKKGNYFIIQTCATGSSAFCASHIYAFKELIPQEMQDGIEEYVYNGWCGNQNTSCELTSSMDVKGDTIIMHYISKTGRIKSNGDVKVRETEKFDVFYTLKNHKWIASDSAKLDKYRY